MALHCPKGELCLIDVQGCPALTNAHPDILRRWECNPQRVKLEVEDAVVRLTSVDDTPIPSHIRLNRMGIYDSLDVEYVDAGKFVFLRNRTFFLAYTAIVHMDLPRYADCRRDDAVGAGFFHLHAETGLVLHGKSVSLDGLKPRFDTLDLRMMTEHIGLHPVPYSEFAEFD